MVNNLNDTVGGYMTEDKTPKELNELWVSHLTNQFFLNRFSMVIQCQFRFLSKLHRKLTVDEMRSMKHYPHKWDGNMTVFGYLTAFYPHIAISLEKTDEYDLITRLKLVKLLLKLNKVVPSKLKRKKERAEIKDDLKEYQAVCIEKVAYKQYRLDASIHGWNKAK
jgi:hypothetical protein